MVVGKSRDIVIMLTGYVAKWLCSVGRVGVYMYLLV